MIKCCKYKICQDHEDAIQIGECPFANDIKKEQKEHYIKLKEAQVADNMFNREMRRLDDKKLEAMDKNIYNYRKELNEKIDNNNVSFFVGGFLVVLLTFIINFFFNVMVVV